MTCGTCVHWRLQGSLAPHGYGQCLARPEQQRAAFTTSALNVCRLGKFVAAAGNCQVSQFRNSQEALL